ncbi:Glutathione S-transferase Mu 3 [Halocaridina rubra]|uniref:Glutathione S-transferase n=1 Tax=Halocaridina rubra TaxID=373956 RepID=A0AAN8XIB2_HALRR
MAPVLGYWKLRGLAQSIRLLLEYVGDDYEEKYFHFKPTSGPDFDRSEWYSVKFNLDLQFPNLPYYIDGDLKITQSNAILRHIARKHNLCGENEREMVQVDVLENQAMDMRMSYVRVAYGNYEEEKQTYFENFKNSLELMSKALGNQKWFVGEKITLPDFILYEIFDIHRVIESSCLESFPNLKDFMKRFEALPNIKKYMSSSRFLAAPLNGPTAKVGGM